jgi:hypothetical protein
MNLTYAENIVCEKRSSLLQYNDNYKNVLKHRPQEDHWRAKGWHLLHPCHSGRRPC